MKEILDTSKSQLVLFTRELEIDRRLPKWSTIEGIAEKELVKKEEVKKKDEVTEMTEVLIDSMMEAPNENVRESIVKHLSVEEIDGMPIRDFNIYLDKLRIEKNGLKSYMTYGDFITINPDVSSDVSLYENSNTKKPNIFRRFFKKLQDSQLEKEQLYTFDAIQFFSYVKDMSKKNQEKYVKRVSEIISALKDAEDMGQTALADALMSEMFRQKYESVLFANGMLHKISEKQLVVFVNKTEKGVALDYIKNFSRPIPKEVRDAKKKADALQVFDNYVVLHFDPESKAYGKTAVEAKKEREKKADPILFGVINGRTDLYYITDWVDEYCDLTLERFLEISKIDKKDISISETPTVMIDGKEQKI